MSLLDIKVSGTSGRKVHIIQPGQHRIRIPADRKFFPRNGERFEDLGVSYAKLFWQLVRVRENPDRGQYAVVNDRYYLFSEREDRRVAIEICYSYEDPGASQILKPPVDH